LLFAVLAVLAVQKRSVLLKAQGKQSERVLKLAQGNIMARQIRQEVEQALGDLPEDKLDEVLDYVMFLTKRCIEEKIRMPADHSRLILHTTPASHLNQLSSLVEWGGNALDDAERLYDDF
jgi:hypothetical protein